MYRYFPGKLRATPVTDMWVMKFGMGIPCIASLIKCSRWNALSFVRKFLRGLQPTVGAVQLLNPVDDPQLESVWF